MVGKIKSYFYDSHPSLPLDPDSDQQIPNRPINTDWAHVAVVGIGAFFGTLARYEIGVWLPDGKNSWPVATLCINLSGAFLLGLLLQLLLRHGRDVGGRRILRLVFGTGFLGAFTTYSTLAVGTALLIRNGHLASSVAYLCTSVLGGICACALGIQIATQHRKQVESKA